MPDTRPALTPADFRAWRRRLGLSQAEAGHHLNRTQVAISNYERGVDPVPPEIVLAAAALEIGPLSLLRRRANSSREDATIGRGETKP